MFSRFLNTLLCSPISYNEIEISRWLVIFYQMVSDKFPHRTSIYNANLFGNSKLGNFESKVVHPSQLLLAKCLQKNFKGIKELFFLSWAIKSYLKIFQTQKKVRCRLLSSRCVIRAHQNIAKLIFSLVFVFPVFTTFTSFEEITIQFIGSKILWRDLVFYETWGDIEPFCIT